MSDERLLVNFLSHRDDAAFEALVRRHGPMVLRVCRDYLGTREHVEDAFQATFLVLVRRAGEIRERESLGRWLYAVACRIARRERRRLIKLRAQERQVAEMEAVAPPDFAPEVRELKPILHEEIARLPARLRDPILLCYFEGRTVEDAASRLGCPVPTLKSRLGKGRELLRSRLTRRGLAAAVVLLMMFSLTEEASAEVPVSLLDSTVKAASHRLGGIRVSRQVASMMLQEEFRRGRFRLASWSLLALLLLIFGASRMAPARKAEVIRSMPLEGMSAHLDQQRSINPVVYPTLLQNLEPQPHCKLR